MKLGTVSSPGLAIENLIRGTFARIPAHRLRAFFNCTGYPYAGTTLTISPNGVSNRVLWKAENSTTAVLQAMKFGAVVANGRV